MKITLLSCLLFSLAFALSGQTEFDQSASKKAAIAFLHTLSPAQKAQANLPFADTSRLHWDNLPMELVTRKGVQMKELADSQRVAVHALLRTVLSQQGYQKILFIIQYDESTHERLLAANNPIASRYGNQNYWVTIFGNPETDKTWSWKFEGHHISLNMTFSPGGVTCTPMFTGVNPALTSTGPYAGYHIMFEENDFGNQLFNDFDEKLKQKARTGDLPTDADVMTRTGNEPHLKEKTGVSFKEMTAKQQLLVENIIKAWVENLSPALATEKMKRILAHKNEIYFTWKGTMNTGELHYYALHTEDFIIEFTNRDGGIGHYHTLWRDLTEDFKGK